MAFASGSFFTWATLKKATSKNDADNKNRFILSDLCGLIFGAPQNDHSGGQI
jgi:hypothetical protein